MTGKANTAHSKKGPQPLLDQISYIAVELHTRIVRAARALWHYPLNILRRVLNIAGLTVDAVLRVDLEALRAISLVDYLIHPCWTVSLSRLIEFRQIDRDRDRRVF